MKNQREEYNEEEYILPYPEPVWLYIESIFKYPLIRGIDHLDTLPRLLGPKREFGLSRNFSPRWIEAVCLRGHFPMSIEGFEGEYIMAVKCHKERCVVGLGEAFAGETERSVRKRAGKMEFAVNRDFDGVVGMIVAKHGDNWLCPMIRKSFKYIALHPQQFDIKIYSIEIWKDGCLVAGELGYTVGTIYTSLTGAYLLSGTGSIQLAALGKFLRSRGFEYWDFGMAMDYKLALGGKPMLREKWLSLCGECKKKGSPSLVLEGAHNARDVIDGHFGGPRPTPQPPAKAPKPPKKDTNPQTKQKRQKKTKTPPQVSQSPETPQEVPKTPQTETLEPTPQSLTEETQTQSIPDPKQ